MSADHWIQGLFALVIDSDAKNNNAEFVSRHFSILICSAIQKVISICLKGLNRTSAPVPGKPFETLYRFGGGGLCSYSVARTRSSDPLRAHCF